MAFGVGDVGPRIDLLLDGQGYLFDDTIDPTSLYSSRQRAQFGISPTFVERQNVSGDYGDDQQDFFLTFTQRDWSLGEQQRYARVKDDDSARRYWQGSKVDVREQGQVRLRPNLKTVTFAAAVVAATAGARQNDLLYAASATNLYSISSDGTITDLGAHGLGATPYPAGLACDVNNVFIAAGGVATRKWNGAFSTFSANGVDAVAFLNNTLYGLRASDGTLRSFDSAGVATTQFTWKAADGSTNGLAGGRLRPFGGKLLILLWHNSTARGSELWLYDLNTVRLAEFPANFYAYDMDVSLGIAFISGAFQKNVGGTTKIRPAIFYYANGTIGLLWQANDFVTDAGGNSVYPAVVSFDSGIIWNDDQRGALMYYDARGGGVQTIATYTVAGSNPVLASWSFSALLVRGQTTAYLFPDSSTQATSATITTSLADFDSSLNKNFHAVKVEFDAATDGDGGSVDVAYRVGDVDGAYTSLITGATSGAEIPFGSVSGKSISIKVTLNKGTSTNGPVLKRISLRASVFQQALGRDLYTLGLYGTDYGPEPQHMRLRDDTLHPKSGAQMAADLRASALKTTPINVTSENGSYVGVIEGESFNIDRIRRGEYRAQFIVRQVT